MSDNFGNLSFKWNPSNIEIKALSVEKALEPLVIHITTLVNTKKTPQRKKGSSKSGRLTVAVVEKAIENFIEKGILIAHENPDIEKEMLYAVDEIQRTGKIMSLAARDFVSDPCSSEKRVRMVQVSRQLLLAVTRLLILADMLDVHLLLKALKLVKDNLLNVKQSTSLKELSDNFNTFRQSACDLMTKSAQRQNDLKDPHLRDDMAAARAVLKKNSTMLFTSSKVYIQNPQLAAAKANRDSVFKQMCEAVNTISDVAQGKEPDLSENEKPGTFAAAVHVFHDSLRNNIASGMDLEQQLEIILKEAMKIVNFSGSEKNDPLLTECNSLGNDLRKLLSEITNNGMNSNKGNMQHNEKSINDALGKSSRLERQIRKAVVERVSDIFLDHYEPLQALVNAAKTGNPAEEERLALMFSDHSNNLIDVANMVCSISKREDGVKMVQCAAKQISIMEPQVINTARIVAAKPHERIALENMEVYCDAWKKQVHVLTEAVDDIIPINVFLSVSENNILEDMKKCVAALKGRESDRLYKAAQTMCARLTRLADAAASEMDNYESDMYTMRVLKAVRMLNEQGIPNFNKKVKVAIDTLSSNRPQDIDDNDFIDASCLVYDQIQEIRQAVVMSKVDEEPDLEDIVFSHKDAELNNHRKDSDTNADRDVIFNMPEEDQRKLAQQAETLDSEKRNFDREVAKWDDTSNDIIILAKHMCVIMMEMTDFTRGKGPLRTSMDVINAAKKISESGTKLDRLARQIADQCPASSTKNDLLAYLQRIALYCHQLNITSKVKADVHSVDEVIVSGLESAISLIQAARNLINAVVLTIKSSYILCAKYPEILGKSASIVWKMKAPEKKPLVIPAKQEELCAKIRRGSVKKTTQPMKALSEFQSLIETF